MYLRFGSRQVPLALILGTVGVFAIVAVAITVAVMLPRRLVDTDNRVPEAMDLPARYDWIDVSDLVVEDELVRGTELRWIPFRARRERWSEADAAEHWIDPRDIGVEVLEAEVDESIRRMLEDAP